MSSVDNRIVEMKFENSRFEKNAKESMKTIDELTEKLEFKGVSKGLSEVENTANKFSLNGMTSAIESVTNRFSVLGAVGFSIIQKITGDAYNAGKRIIDSLTIKPVATGLEEYETKINSIQTIATNTKKYGTTLADVNKALDELNLYADKTIYNFTQMTSSLGLFTTQGLDLETSASAIKGIANLAAYVGAPASDASRAMYQLSQALATGDVRLQDWMSLENTAGMAGQEFQQRLIDTARVLGKKVDWAIDKEGSFRASLKHGWLDTEVLTNTLAQFAGAVDEATLAQQGFSEEQIKSIVELGKMATESATVVKTYSQLKDTLAEAAQSGWTQTWEILIGDLDEAKNLFTEISNVVGGIVEAQANARNELLQGWKDMGGRDLLIEAFTNVYESISRIITPIKNAFRDIFPPTTAETLYSITSAIESFTEKLVISEHTSENIGRTFKGLFSILGLGRDTIVGVFSAFSKLDLGLPEINFNITDLTAKFGDFLVKVSESVRSSKAFETVINTIASGLSGVLKVAAGAVAGIKEFISAFAESFSSGFLKSFLNLENVNKSLSEFKSKLTDIPTEVGSKFGNFMNTINDRFSGFFEFLGKVRSGIKQFASDIAAYLAPLGNKIKEAWNNVTFTKLLGSGMLGGIFAIIGSFIKRLGKGFDGVDELLDSVKGVLDSTRGALEAWQNRLNAGTLIKIAGAVAILAASIIALSTVNGNIQNGIIGVSVILAEIVAALEVLNKFPVKGVGSATVSIIGIAVAMNQLSKAVANISGISGAESVVSTIAITTAMISELLGAIMLLNKFNTKGAIKSAASMYIIASAMNKMGDAITILSKIDPTAAARGLAVMGTVLAETGAFLVAIGVTKSGGQYKNIIALASATLLLYEAVKHFGELDSAVIEQGMDSLTKSLAALTLSVGALSIANGAMGGLSKVPSTVLAVVTALNVLVKPIKVLGQMDPESLSAGITGIVSALAALTVSMSLLSAAKFLLADFKGIATSMLAMATALSILIIPIKTLGEMNPDGLAAGIIGVASALGAMTVALGALSVIKGLSGSMAGIAPALIGMAAALAIVAIPIKMIGGMDLQSVALGVGALAVALVAMGATMAVLSPFGAALVVVAGAFTLFGAAIAGIGIGIAALATGLTALAALGSVGAIAVVAAIGTIVNGVAALIPNVMAVLAQGMASFALVIIDAAPVLGEAVTALLLTLLNIIRSVGPSVIETFATIMESLITTIASHTPKMIQAGFQIVMSFLDGLRQNIQEMVIVGTDIVLEFIRGVEEKLPEVLDEAFKFIIEFLNGLADAIDQNAEIVGAAMGRLAVAMIQGLVAGLKAYVGEVISAAKDIANQVVTAFKDIMGIHSPSTVMKDEVGRWIVKGIAEGIKEDTSAEEAAKIKAQNIVSAFKDVLDLFQLGSDTEDLEWQLWSETNKNVADSEKNMAEMDHLQRQIDWANQRIDVAKGELDNTVAQFGVSSEEAREAYNKLLKEKIELVKLANEYEEVKQQLVENFAKEYPEMGPGFDFSSMVGDAEAIKEAKEKQKEMDESWTPFGRTEKKERAPEPVDTETFESFMEQYDPTDIVENIKAKMDMASLVALQEATAVEAMESVATGIEEGGAQHVIPASTKVAKDSNEAIANEEPEYKATGFNLVKGLADGITSNKSTAVNAAISVAREALRAAKDELEIESPSRKAMELGEYFTTGFANGIENAIPKSSKASSNMSNDALWAVQETIGTIDDIINETITDPLISPHMNLSEVLAGEKRIKAIGNTTTGLRFTDLSETSRKARAAVAQINQNGSESTQSGNEDVVNAVNSLGERLNYLGKSMQGLKVVMDTGSVVGAIEQPIDQRLGIIASRKERGI